jgi:hypothetical protein
MWAWIFVFVCFAYGTYELVKHGRKYLVRAGQFCGGIFGAFLLGSVFAGKEWHVVVLTGAIMSGVFWTILGFIAENMEKGERASLTVASAVGKELGLAAGPGEKTWGPAAKLAGRYEGFDVLIGINLVGMSREFEEHELEKMNYNLTIEIKLPKAAREAFAVSKRSQAPAWLAGEARQKLEKAAATGPAKWRVRAKAEKLDARVQGALQGGVLPLGPWLEAMAAVARTF